MDSNKLYKVLIVEDNPKYSKPLQAHINQDDNFTVLEVTDSVKDALKIIKTALPDAIIVDLQLAEGDGFDLLNQVCQLRGTLSIFPYILVTTKFESETVMDILCDGLVDYVFSKHNNSYCPKEILKHLRLASKHFHRNKKRDTQVLPTELEQEEMHRTRIYNEINQYYLNQGSQGVAFLVEMIYRAMQIPKHEKIHIGELYITVGKQFNVTANTVDMSIRRLLNGAFLKTAVEDIERLFTPYIDIGRGVPRNKEFIVYVANKLREENI